MMLERGLTVDHSTIARWVLRYGPVLNERNRSEMRQPNRSWRADEIYVRVSGQWTYLYGAIDSAGNTIDFLLSPYRDLVAARAFAACSGPGRPQSAARDQRGRPSGISSGYRGSEAIR